MEKDKLYHFVATLVVSLVSTKLALGLSIGKEYGDSKAVGNYWSWEDIAADTAGMLVGTALRIWLISAFCLEHAAEWILVTS